MFRAKKEVIASIKAIPSEKNGKHYTIFSAFLGRDSMTGEKKRVARANRQELIDYINEFYRKLERGGIAAVQLSHAQAADAQAALDLIAQHRLNLSLVDCVRAIVSGGAPTSQAAESKTTIGDAWRRYFETLAQKSADYKRTVRSRVGRWVAAIGESSPLSAITPAGVKDYLLAKVYRANEPKTAKTYNGVLGDIITFVRWCASREQGLLTANPLDGMKKMEIGYHQPEYAKAADVEKLFRVLEKHKAEAPADLADAILSFFCGMRQAEIERVREGDEAVRISLEDHFIRVIKCKGSLRGVRPRAFRTPKQAEDWMRSFDFLSAVHVRNKQFRRHLKARAREAGIKLPKNAGRHTFITMFEAAHHDANALSAIVGNTEGVRSRSYNGVEVEREGRAYFEIAPTAASEMPKAPPTADSAVAHPAIGSEEAPVSAAS